MKRNLSALFFALTLISFAGLARAQSPAPADKSAQVDALLAQYTREGEPGAVVAVIQDGKVVHQKGYGLADLENRTRMGADTAFDLASVSKQFTAMAVMMLVERGKLSYDDPLPKFFPGLPPYAKGITVRHLLNHTSGLPDVLTPDMHRAGYQPSSRELVSVLAQRKDADFSPGERFKYNNTGYVLLALIVEKASGRPFPQFMQENIFRPLGMSRTVVWDETRPAVGNRALPYAPEAGAFRSLPFGSDVYIFGAKGVVTTAEDIYKWDQALYTEKLVRAATLREAFVPARLNDGRESYYGFGWNLGQDRGLNLVRHDGGYLGYRTIVARYPDQKFTVVILSNSNRVGSTSSLTRRIARIYLGDRMRLPATAKVAPETLRDYAGRYRADAGGPTTEVAPDGDGLLIRIEGQGAHRLEPLSASEFFDDEAESIRFQFNRDEKGKVTSFTFKGAGGPEQVHRKLAEAGAAADPKKYDDLVGQYQLRPGFFVKVTSEGGRLFVQDTGGMKGELRPESGHRFSMAGGGPDVVFVRTFLREEARGVISFNANDQIARRVGLPAPAPVEPAKLADGWGDGFDGQALDSSRWERFTFEGAGDGKAEVRGGQLRLRGAQDSRSGVRTRQTFAGESFTVEATVGKVAPALTGPDPMRLPVGHAILAVLFDGSEQNRLEWILTSEGTFEAWAIVNGQGARLDGRDLGTNIVNPTLGVVRSGDEFTFTVNGQEALRKSVKGLGRSFQVMLYGYSSTESDWDAVRVAAAGGSSSSR